MKAWCLVRWAQGRTTAILKERGEPVGAEERERSTCPRTGASVCGPVSMVMDSAFYCAGLGVTGFPKEGVGKLLQFDSKAEAQTFVGRHDGSWITIDIPMPMAAITFWVRQYSHYDGKETRLFESTDVRACRAEAALAREEASNYERIFVEFAIDWEKVGDNRPTQAQADAMWAQDRKNKPAREPQSRELSA